MSSSMRRAQRHLPENPGRRHPAEAAGPPSQGRVRRRQVGGLHLSYDTIEVAPVTPYIGAEVGGVDLRKPSNRQFEEIHSALLEYQVLFFRDQPLDLEAHMAFGRHFGELHTHPGAPGVPGHPEVMPVRTDAKSTYIAGESWHSDVSCDPEPPMGSILHMREVPPVGGDTLFASMYVAYERLSPRMKTYLEGLTATHD